MEVPEELWLQAMVSTYARKYLTYHNTSFHPFASTQVAQILTESFWIGRTIYKLKNLPSNECQHAVSHIINEFHLLPLHGDKFIHLKNLVNKLKSINELASINLDNCL